MRKIAIALLSPALMAGCTLVVRPYVPPVDGPHSSLVVDNQFSKHASVFFYDGAERCTERRGAGTVEPHSSKIFSIPAGQPVSTNVISTISNSGFYVHFCRITIEFAPREGKRYILSTDYNGETCLAALTSEGQQVPFKTREYNVPLDEAGPFCKP